MRSLLLLLALTAPAQAQLFDTAVRYELGQRLRDFERALAKHSDPKAIERAIPPVAAATPAFFGGRLGEAAGILDRARLTLQSEKPGEGQLWASSWRFTPARRVAGAKADKLSIRISSFYKPSTDAPADFRVKAVLSAGGREASTSKLPGSLELTWKDLPEGDHVLTCSIQAGGETLFESRQTVSVIDDFEGRLKKLQDREARGKSSIASATLAHHLDILAKLSKGTPLETNYPAHRLLTEAESIAAEKWDAKKPGEYWLSLPGVAGSPVRLFVPEQAKDGKPLPVVVALHGAGGSENMFFDGYGDGLVVELARKRGWFLVATRSPLLGGGPNASAVVDVLAKQYPIDAKKVFLVGHSMGAAQAVSLAGRSPERFRAVAALGGGGAFKAADGIKGLPFYVGVGQKDFALGNARGLSQRLEKAGAKVTFKNWPHVEHLTIVQLALPEVYAMFDKALVP